MLSQSDVRLYNHYTEGKNVLRHIFHYYYYYLHSNMQRTVHKTAWLINT